MQAAQGERVKLHPLDSVDAVEMQPGGRGLPGVGIGAMSEQQRGAPPHPARHESDDRLTGGVEPLQVVDRDQDRRAVLERVDDRQHRRGQHLRVRDGRLVRGLVEPVAHQETGDRAALHLGQVGDDVGSDVGQQFGDRGPGPHRLGPPSPRRQHVHAGFPGALQTCLPHRALADAGFPVEHQCGGP